MIAVLYRCFRSAIIWIL